MTYETSKEELLPTAEDKANADKLLYTMLLTDDIVERFNIIRTMDTQCAKECLYTIIDHLHRSGMELIVMNNKDTM